MSTRFAVPGRVHIMGGAGAGKSTLARRCAAALGIESVDLDYLTLPRSPDGTSLDGEERYEASLAAATEIATRERWVTEGIYCGWTGPLMARADAIVWIDLHPAITTWRIVRRHVGRSIAGENNFRGLKLLARFAGGVLVDRRSPAATEDQLRESMNYNSRATTERYLAPYQDKTVHCTSARDVAALLRRWSAHAG